MVGCLKGHRNTPHDLLSMNVMALHHYYECAATGQWPDDPVVRERAGLLYRLWQLYTKESNTEQMIEMYKHLLPGR